MARGPHCQQPAVPGQAGCTLFFALHPTLSPASRTFVRGLDVDRQRREMGTGARSRGETAGALSGAAVHLWSRVPQGELRRGVTAETQADRMHPPGCGQRLSLRLSANGSGKRLPLCLGHIFHSGGPWLVWAGQGGLTDVSGLSTAQMCAVSQLGPHRPPPPLWNFGGQPREVGSGLLLREV